jgi:hypothetical protein
MPLGGSWEEGLHAAAGGAEHVSTIAIAQTSVGSKVQRRSIPAHSPLQNLRLKSRAIRVKPEGLGAAKVCGKWPRLITAMMTKNKNTDGIRDNAERNMDASLASCICPKNEARASPDV